MTRITRRAIPFCEHVFSSERNRDACVICEFHANQKSSRKRQLPGAISTILGLCGLQHSECAWVAHISGWRREVGVVDGIRERGFKAAVLPVVALTSSVPR